MSITANIKISELTPQTTVTGNEMMPVSYNNGNGIDNVYQTYTSEVATYIGSKLNISGIQSKLGEVSTYLDNVDTWVRASYAYTYGILENKNSTFNSKNTSLNNSYTTIRSSYNTNTTSANNQYSSFKITGSLDDNGFLLTHNWPNATKTVRIPKAGDTTYGLLTLNDIHQYLIESITIPDADWSTAGKISYQKVRELAYQVGHVPHIDIQQNANRVHAYYWLDDYKATGYSGYVYFTAAADNTYGTTTLNQISTIANTNVVDRELTYTYHIAYSKTVNENADHISTGDKVGTTTTAYISAIANDIKNHPISGSAYANDAAKGVIVYVNSSNTYYDQKTSTVITEATSNTYGVIKTSTASTYATNNAATIIQNTKYGDSTYGSIKGSDIAGIAQDNIAPLGLTYSNGVAYKGLRINVGHGTKSTKYVYIPAATEDSIGVITETYIAAYAATLGDAPVPANNRYIKSITLDNEIEGNESVLKITYQYNGASGTYTAKSTLPHAGDTAYGVITKSAVKEIIKKYLNDNKLKVNGNGQLRFNFDPTADGYNIKFAYNGFSSTCENSSSSNSIVIPGAESGETDTVARVLKNLRINQLTLPNVAGNGVQISITEKSSGTPLTPKDDGDAFLSKAEIESMVGGTEVVKTWRGTQVEEANPFVRTINIYCDRTITAPKTTRVIIRPSNNTSKSYSVNKTFQNGNYVILSIDDIFAAYKKFKNELGAEITGFSFDLEPVNVATNGIFKPSWVVGNQQFTRQQLTTSGTPLTLYCTYNEPVLELDLRIIFASISDKDVTDVGVSIWGDWGDGSTVVCTYMCGSKEGQIFKTAQIPYSECFGSGGGYDYLSFDLVCDASKSGGGMHTISPKYGEIATSNNLTFNYEQYVVYGSANSEYKYNNFSRFSDLVIGNGSDGNTSRTLNIPGLTKYNMTNNQTTRNRISSGTPTTDDVKYLASQWWWGSQDLLDPCINALNFKFKPGTTKATIALILSDSPILDAMHPWINKYNITFAES